MVGDGPEHVLRELAADGAWTRGQLRTRLSRWGADEPTRYLAHATVAVRPTAWSHRYLQVDLVRPSRAGYGVLREMGIRAQVIRPDELEHALGLAELRWRCGASAERYHAQDVLARDHRRARAAGDAGLGPAIADGVYEAQGGVVLCEYDHGRYTSRQILAKLGAFRSGTRLEGKRVVGTVWGAPTERRAARLHELGADQVMVLAPETWLR